MPAMIIATDAAFAQQIIDAIKTCYDPEIPVDIWELGLIYEINVNETNEVKVIMTLTSPNCPAAESLPAEVEQKVKDVPGVVSAKVEISFDPPWEKEMMSEVAQLELGFM
jgi:FeS assembly SUF system protein